MLGKKIKYHRARLRLSQQKLSEALGVSQAAIAYYESDKNQPSPDIILKLSQIFGVSIDELYDYNVNAASVWADFTALRDEQKEIIYTLIETFKKVNNCEGDTCPVLREYQPDESSNTKKQHHAGRK